MSKFVASAILVSLLASCGAGEPIGGGGGGGTDGGIDTPDVGDGSGGGTDNPDSGDSQSLRALYGGEVNSARYDPNSGELIINNLPLDGQSYYEFNSEIAGFQTFTNSEEALRQYYAVRREAGSVEVAAVGTGDYQGAGYGGYLIRRDSDTVDLPATGEAVYTGPYAGVRVRSGDEQGTRNIVYSKGDAILEVDFADFDVVGAVEGRIINRRFVEIDGAESDVQPAIILATGQIEGSGRFSGEAAIAGSDPSGSYVGLFAGPNGEEAGGAILISDENDTVLERGVFTVAD